MTILQKKNTKKMTISRNLTILQWNHRKMTILQRNYRKMTILWSFSYNSFEISMVKTFGSQNMTVFYPNLCNKEVCFKGTAMYS